MFCLSANEQRKRDQIAASKSDGNAYVVAVVDNMVPWVSGETVDALEFASIRHFLWSDDVTMLRLEPDSFLAHVEPSAGRPLLGVLKQLGPLGQALGSAQVGLVIGKGGATVKWMSQESGAQIHRVDGTADTGLASLKRLDRKGAMPIEGTKEQIQYAKQLIQEAPLVCGGAAAMAPGGRQPPVPAADGSEISSRLCALVSLDRTWEDHFGAIEASKVPLNSLVLCGTLTATCDVETDRTVDIEWTDYEKRRYTKYKARPGPAVRSYGELWFRYGVDIAIFLQIPEPQLEKLQDLWPPIRDSFTLGNLTFAPKKEEGAN
eukprot:Skav202275  [mRNA]  locus=scaffold3044:69649:74743:- [translate_table: standard]